VTKLEAKNKDLQARLDWAEARIRSPEAANDALAAENNRIAEPRTVQVVVYSPIPRPSGPIMNSPPIFALSVHRLSPEPSKLSPRQSKCQRRDNRSTALLPSSKPDSDGVPVRKCNCGQNCLACHFGIPDHFQFASNATSLRHPEPPAKQRLPVVGQGTWLGVSAT
jgi:hypothetical protein